MNLEQEKIINNKLKVYEAIKILNDTNYETIKEDINLEISLSKKQCIALNRKINILKAISLFLNKKCYIKEIADELQLSTSCIQRYLNDPIIEELLGEKIKKEIDEKLKFNLNSGREKGGENYSVNNEAIKLENGKFAGSIKRMSI